MSNETNPGTVIGRNMAAHSIQFGNGNRVFMKITADGELIVNDATEAAKALKAEWDKLFPERPAAHSQPAATVQEAIDFKYWLMDAARILRSNGTDTHASWVEKALAALTAEPAAKAGDATFAAWLKHYVGKMDAATMRFSVDEMRIAFEAGQSSSAALSSPASQSVEAVELLRRWSTWACGQHGVSPFHDTRSFLSALPHKEEATPATTKRGRE